MKYRRLTLDELKELEKEFINFLSMNSIPANDWEKMKTQNPGQAESFIETFSDMVLDKAIQKIEFLELRSKNNALFFHCTTASLIVYSISTPAHTLINFESPTVVNDIANGKIKLENGDLNLKKFEQTYTSERGEEIFKLTEQGALITDGKIIQTLETLLA